MQEQILSISHASTTGDVVQNAHLRENGRRKNQGDCKMDLAGDPQMTNMHRRHCRVHISIADTPHSRRADIRVEGERLVRMRVRRQSCRGVRFASRCDVSFETIVFLPHFEQALLLRFGLSICVTTFCIQRVRKSQGCGLHCLMHVFDPKLVVKALLRKNRF
jgi:hypothetical protein